VSTNGYNGTTSIWLQYNIIMITLITYSYYEYIGFYDVAASVNITTVTMVLHPLEEY
jgi:hypothetical protein